MKIDFTKSNGLVPVIIQDSISLKVLMLGYMDEEALAKTLKEGLVTFFSRTSNGMWTKGATSGNYLNVESILTDCDNDTLLITVTPSGPTCHSGSESCFAIEDNKGFIYELEKIIRNRIAFGSGSSYTNRLYKEGINKVAQKVGEEAIELVIEVKDNNVEFFKNEAADLLYHFLVLLSAKDCSLANIEKILSLRHNNHDN